VGRGRRAIAEEGAIVGLTTAVLRLLDDHAELKRCKEPGARQRACREVQRALAELATSQEVRAARPALEEIGNVLFRHPRQKNRTRAMFLVSQMLGFAPRTVRKLAQTHAPKSPS
jgi:hypothetical protein